MTANYDHVIWDWNGTLLDDSMLCVEIMNGMLEQRAMPTITLTRYRETFTFPVREYYVQSGFDLEEESFEDLSVQFISTYESRRLECGLQSGAHQVLEHVRSSGRSQSILSAYEHRTLVQLIHKLELDHYFERLVGLDNIYAGGKVEQGRRLVEDLPHETDRVILVGDTLHDAEVAHDLGIDCILVEHGHQTRERLAASGAPVVATLDDLFDRL